MKFKVFLLRCDGYPLPRFRTAFLKPVVGHLQIMQEYDKTRRRSAYVARIVDPVTCAVINEIRPLLDVTIVYSQSDYLVLAGLERIPSRLETQFCDVAQSWLLEIANEA